MTDQAHVLVPRRVPTMYFVGVTTRQSSIMKVFPKWSDVLGLGAQIDGYDAPLHAPAEHYRAIVEHIKSDPLSMGALVTTHKIDLLEGDARPVRLSGPLCRALRGNFASPKRDGMLRGHAKGPITSGLAWEAFVEPGYWGRSGGHVLCLGAGGSAVAISVYLTERPDAADRPAKFIAVNRSQPRLTELRRIHERIKTDITFEYVLNQDPRANDARMAALPPGSMVINATGMGKDRPGSPITDDGLFPLNGIAWELNYRGKLDFMHQALRQSASRGVKVEDGWVYFLHGWSQVVAEVFDVTLTPALFAELDRAAASIRS